VSALQEERTGVSALQKNGQECPRSRLTVKGDKWVGWA